MQRTPFDIPEQMRDVADKSVDQARKAFDQFMDATQKAVAKAEGSAKSLSEGAADLNRQTLAYNRGECRGVLQAPRPTSSRHAPSRRSPPCSRSSCAGRWRRPPSRARASAAWSAAPRREAVDKTKK